MSDFEVELIDYFAEVSVCGFADMLHDRDRNEKYEQAIQKAIKYVKNRGQIARVLDIGTGTGLLSMMAARHGADSIIACESFKPMSQCAQNTIDLNGFSDRIHVIPKRSTNLRVCQDGTGDLMERCNILVTEIFDSELIGEGALEIFRHANQNLLTCDYIVVPNKADIFIQIVESDYLMNWHRLNNLNFEKFNIKLPKVFQQCSGALPVHDVQLTQLDSNLFRPLTDPTVIFQFDFKTFLSIEEDKCIELKASNSGKVQNIFMWWQLQMDYENEIILTCAPDRDCALNSDRWRDHWMQLIYYIPNPIAVAKNDLFKLYYGHSEYSFWFNTSEEKRLDCICDLHMISTRSQIGNMNDQSILRKFSNSLQKLSNIRKCLFVSELSVVPFLLPKDIQLYWQPSDNIFSTKLMQRIAFENAIKFDFDEPTDIDLILIDPYFSSSFLPWDNLICLQRIHKFLKEHRNVTMIPQKATIWAVAVHFVDLFKIVKPVKNCCSFEMSPFDNLIKAASNVRSRTVIDAQALWEYPGYCLSDPVPVLELSFKKLSDSDISGNGHILSSSLKQPNAVALWIDWYLDDENIVSTGPTSPLKIDHIINWCQNSKQGVYFIMDNDSNETTGKILFEADFDHLSTKTTFKFSH